MIQPLLVIAMPTYRKGSRKRRPSSSAIKPAPSLDQYRERIFPAFEADNQQLLAHNSELVFVLAKCSLVNTRAGSVGILLRGHQ